MGHFEHLNRHHCDVFGGEGRFSVFSAGKTKVSVMHCGSSSSSQNCPQVVKAIDDGFRLPAPVNCQPALHQLMLDCWQKDCTERPKFSYIHGILGKMLQNAEPLKNNTFTYNR